MAANPWIVRIEELSRKLECNWAPPASEAALRAFENEWGVELPADYREVLSLLGNGMTGPVEIAPLGHVPDDDGWAEGEWDELAAAFPCRATPRYWKKDDEIEGDLDGDHPGALLVADDTIQVQWLIVTGAERGHMWELGSGSPSPTANPLLRTLTFSQWLAVELAKASKRADLIDTWLREEPFHGALA